MSEPEFLPNDRRADFAARWSRNHPRLIRVLVRMRRFINRAIAKPGRSAVATLAMGVIVGSCIRTLLLRHPGPNAASAGVVTETTNASSKNTDHPSANP